MISVPSRHQPLNGNKMRLFICCCILLFAYSCKTTKKAKPGTRSPKSVNLPKPDSTLTTLYEIDTVFWEEIDLSEEYADRMEELIMDKKSVYNIKLLLPFEISKNNKNDVFDKSTKLGRMMHYYCGILMALDQLAEEGVMLNVESIDAESGRFQSKLQRCADADVIIGPRNTDQLTEVGEFGKKNKITVVSPWKSGSKISEDNPYFIQMRTGLRDHFFKIVEDALEEFEAENIYILGREENREDATYSRILQSMASAILGTADEAPLRNFLLNEDSLMYGKYAFDKLFDEKSAKCFLLPNWSFSKDENFVYNVTRKMSGEKGLNELVLYGLPILFESDKINFELYRSLNMRVCRSSYVDPNSPFVRAFKQAYFERFNDFPADEAFEAYDMMLFIGRNLFRYGTGFQYFLDQAEDELIQTKFDIRRVFDEEGMDKFDDIEYFQNQHLYILRFEDERFVAY